VTGGGQVTPITGGSGVPENTLSKSPAAKQRKISPAATQLQQLLVNK
jgi:hypothetical protein